MKSQKLCSLLCAFWFSSLTVSLAQGIVENEEKQKIGLNFGAEYGLNYNFPSSNKEQEIHSLEGNNWGVYLKLVNLEELETKWAISLGYQFDNTGYTRGPFIRTDFMGNEQARGDVINELSYHTFNIALNYFFSEPFFWEAGMSFHEIASRKSDYSDLIDNGFPNDITDSFQDESINRSRGIGFFSFIGYQLGIEDRVFINSKLGLRSMFLWNEEMMRVFGFTPIAIQYIFLLPEFKVGLEIYLTEIEA